MDTSEMRRRRHYKQGAGSPTLTSGSTGGRLEKLAVPFEANLEIRKAPEGEAGDSSAGIVYVEGLWAVFGTVNWYDEILVAGAAAETIAERGPKSLEGGKRSSKIKMLWQHDSEKVLGLPEVVEETKEGIYARTPVRTLDRNGNPIQERINYLDQVEHGEVDSFSIGFIADEVEYEWVEGRERDTAEPPDMIDWFFGDAIRKVTKLTLFEGSLVTFPAEENALVDRAAEEHEVALALRSMSQDKRDAYISRITSIPRELVAKAREVLDELDQAIANEAEPDEEDGEEVEEEQTEEQEGEEDGDGEEDEEFAAAVAELEQNAVLQTMETRMRRLRSA